ncbi:MAG: glycosyltransferase [Pseudomonadota bacterium]
MRVLIVHQNFPGQFPHIADALVARGDEVVAIGGPTSKERQGIRLVRWKNIRGSAKDIFPPAVRAEADLIRAEVAALVAVELRDAGFVPDVVIGHPGWGETIHMKAVFPDAPLILFGEFFYRHIGADVNFDREFETPTLKGAMYTTGKSASQLLGYSMADLIISPTRFQASTFPAILQPKIRVLHEGVDLSRARRNPDALFKLPDGSTLDASSPVITFINRNFERLRGYHIFMRALPRFLDAVPDAQVILIGADGKGYGSSRKDGKTWREAMFNELGSRLDRKRLHFVGQVEHRHMINILSIGAAHVYYTYPFVLSWSLAEAMACECLVIGSDTAPVRDAITDGKDGILLDFFDVDALSQAMIDAVRQPDRYRDMRRQARLTALELFDRESMGVPGWLAMIDELAERDRLPGA